MPRESLGGGHVKGGILRSRLNYLEGLADGRAEVRRRLSPETALLLDGPVLAIAWYPYGALIELDHAIASLVGGDEREVMIQLGRHSARLNLGTTYRIYRRSTPHDFFETSARLHSQYQDFGRQEYERTGPTACRLSIVEQTWFSQAYCWSAIGYYEEVVRQHGGGSPWVREAECTCDEGPACRFEIRWS